jgi:K+-dependent Na+/Ca+ exchanger-like protein
MMRGKYRNSHAARKLYVVGIIFLAGIWLVLETKSYLTSPELPTAASASDEVAQSAARKLLSGVEIIPGFNGGKCGSNFYFTANSKANLQTGEYLPGDTVKKSKDEWEKWGQNGVAYPDECLSLTDNSNRCTNPQPYQQWEANSGGIVYVILSIWLFLGIAIICDGAFTDSLEMICSRYGLNLSEDVAGATFMAAGSSAPELATSFLGTFVAESGVGLGTILGSAVFNILVIIGAVAFLSSEPLKLDYRPIIRDNFFYVTSVILLCILLATDNEASLFDSALLVFWYCLYILFLCYNEPIMAKLFPQTEEEAAESAAVAVIQETPMEEAYESKDPEPEPALESKEPEVGVVPETAVAADVISTIGASSVMDDDADAEVGDDEHLPAEVEIAAEADVEVIADAGDGTPAESAQEKGSGNGAGGDMQIQLEANPIAQGVATPDTPPGADTKGLIAEKEEEAEPTFAEMSVLEKIMFIFSWPFEFVFTWTMPDCHMEFDEDVEEAWNAEYSEASPERKKEMVKEMWDAVEETGPKWFWLTFAMSLLHISWLAYFMVEFMLKIGCLWGIPDVLMGLTFLAAGTSIPDALGSISVAQEGKGDMAVSNAVGSNVFDICVGLGFPWLIKLLIDSGEACNYLVIFNADKEVVPTIIILMTIIVVLFSTFYYFNWILSPQAGYVFFITYILFFIYCFLNTFVVQPSTERCNLPCCT